jgi:hypothetical protein
MVFESRAKAHHFLTVTLLPLRATDHQHLFFRDEAACSKWKAILGEYMDGKKDLSPSSKNTKISLIS